MIQTIRNNLSLFGFTPEKLWSRLNQRTAPKILSNSIPKSGTHLLERLLYLLPGLSRQFYPTLCDDGNGLPNLKKQCSRLKPGQFIVSHLFYDDAYMKILDESGVRIIFMIRDPRDIVISNVHYITQINLKHRLHEYFVQHLKSDKERLRFCIRGSAEPPEYSIREYLEKFHPWLAHDRVLNVRFGDLVGARGGGTDEAQARTVSKILDFIGFNLSQEEIQVLKSRIFSRRSKTYHRGKIRQWKENFDDEDKKLFKDVAGDWLIKYGYEKDFDW